MLIYSRIYCKMYIHIKEKYTAVENERTKAICDKVGYS